MNNKSHKESSFCEEQVRFDFFDKGKNETCLNFSKYLSSCNRWANELKMLRYLVGALMMPHIYREIGPNKLTSPFV